jgi:hypothetical protein
VLGASRPQPKAKSHQRPEANSQRPKAPQPHKSTKNNLNMKNLIYIFGILLLCSCAGSPENKKVESISEEEFVPPPNPFTVSGPDTTIADSSSRVRKAEKPGMKPPKIEFEKKEYVFDSLPAGKNFRGELNFRNRGEQPLEISNVRSSRTALLQWSKLLIAAEEQSSIRYSLKVPDKSGNFSDTLFIESNAGSDKLILKGVVR